MFMDVSYLPIMFGCVAALFIVALLVMRRMEQRRTEALRNEAARLGLSFEEKGAGLEQEDFYMLPLFSQGHTKKFRNVMRNDDEILFDYTYTIGGGKNQSIVQQSVAAFRETGRDLPHFQLKPENLGDRIAAKFGGQDIDFPEDTEFSSAVRLRGIGELKIREVFDSRVRRVVLDNPGWDIQGTREWLIAFRKRQRPEPERFTEFATEARRIAERFAAR